MNQRYIKQDKKKLKINQSSWRLDLRSFGGGTKFFATFSLAKKELDKFLDLEKAKKKMVEMLDERLKALEPKTRMIIDDGKPGDNF